MKICILGFYGEVEYMSDICQSLRKFADVLFLPVFKWIYEEHLSNIYQLIYTESKNADVVFWQCLHSLDLHDVMYIIKKTTCKNILLSIDDNRKLSDFDLCYIQQRQLMDLVITTSQFNAEYMQSYGHFIHPVVNPLLGKAQYRQTPTTDTTKLFVHRDGYCPTYAFELATDISIPEHSFDIDGIFVNLYQPAVGCATNMMLYCMSMGVTVISPRTTDLDASFIAGQDYIELTSDLLYSIKNGKPLLPLATGSIRETVLRNTYDQLQCIQTLIINPVRHYPILPQRTLDTNNQVRLRTQFDPEMYTQIHELSLTGTTEAWNHYCHIGYPNGMFYCGCDPNSIPDSTPPIGEAGLYLLNLAFMTEQIQLLKLTEQLRMDPFPIVSMMVYHTGLGENPNRSI